ncbi:unnamed protein product [Blepharisma stoltei]|uniref:Uncharacterized protein n=1 Tax=Blepharisma stoltei TaxID=1481888 RepID=A0AAU9JUU1_9CILI|nr:unnamed protein product [Blepharisma stoltei]
MIAQISTNSISLNSIFNSLSQQCSNLSKISNSNVSDLEKLVSDIKNNIYMLKQANENMMECVYNDSIILNDQNKIYLKIQEVSAEIENLKAEKLKHIRLKKILDNLFHQQSIFPERFDLKKKIRKIQRQLRVLDEKIL